MAQFDFRFGEKRPKTRIRTAKKFDFDFVMRRIFAIFAPLKRIGYDTRAENT